MEITIDADLDDILYQCSSRDIKYLINYLVENNHIHKLQTKPQHINKKSNIHDDLWDEALIKLKDNRHLLSVSEVNYIQQIANKIP